MTSEQENFISFVEENPEFYTVMRSYTFLQILFFINEKPRAFNDLLVKFNSIEERDLRAILFTLKKINMIKTLKLKENKAYFLTPKTKIFLKKYAKTKEHFFG